MSRKNTISSILDSLNIGDSYDFPANKACNVRSMASMLGFQWDKVFTTATDREKRIITVTRTA